MRARLLILWTCLSLGCGADPTEIVLVVDTDIPGADAFSVEGRFGSEPRRATADLSVQAAPRTLVLLHEGGPLGPHELLVEASAGGATVGSARREVTFEPEESLTLRVFLSDACPDRCPDGLTCGNDGACRDATVRPCEYDGRSCGAPDGGIDGGPMFDGGGDEDGGLCASIGGICGIADRHLPGDWVAPEPCGMPPEVPGIAVEGPTGPVTPVGGRFLLETSGSYVVHLRGSTCELSRTIEVPAPAVYEDTAMVTSAELRDLAARVGAGFVVGRRGIYAVDDTGWYDLRMIAGGAVEENQRAVVAVGETPFAGPAFDRDEIYRVDAQAPFATASIDAVPIGGGNKIVRALAAVPGATDRLAIATVDSLMIVDDPLGAPSAAPLGGGYGADWVALGERDHDAVGQLWGGTVDALVNRDLGGGDTLAGGDPVTPPAFLGPLSQGLVDPRIGVPNLWLCGAGALARFELPAGIDWSSQTTLPMEVARWDETCVDLATDPGEDVWIASGGEGLARVAMDGTLVLRLGTGQGLPAGFSADAIATAWDATSREVWVLDRTARRIARFSAPRIP